MLPIRPQDEAGLLNQAACINLLSNAAVVWTTVYMARVLDQLRAEGVAVKDEDVRRLSPCRHEHINRLGRYHFDALPDEGEFRPTDRRYR